MGENGVEFWNLRDRNNNIEGSFVHIAPQLGCLTLSSQYTYLV